MALSFRASCLLLPASADADVAATSYNLALVQAPQMQISDMLAERWAT